MKFSISSELNNTFWLFSKIFLLFIFSFELYRTIFFVYYYDKLAATNTIFSEILLTYWYALSVDISTASFAIVIPWVLILLYSLIRLEIFKYLLKFYVYVILFIVSASYIAELGVYNEWEVKPNYEIFS